MGKYSKVVAAGGAGLLAMQLIDLIGPLLAYYLPAFHTGVWMAEGFKEALVAVATTLAVYFAPPNDPVPEPVPVPVPPPVLPA